MVKDKDDKGPLADAMAPLSEVIGPAIYNFKITYPRYHPFANNAPFYPKKPIVVERDEGSGTWISFLWNRSRRGKLRVYPKEETEKEWKKTFYIEIDYFVKGFMMPPGFSQDTVDQNMAEACAINDPVVRGHIYGVIMSILKNSSIESYEIVKCEFRDLS